MSNRNKVKNRKLTKSQALQRIKSLDSHCESDSQSNILENRTKRLTKKTSTPAAKRVTKKDATPASKTDNNAIETDQPSGKSLFVYLKKIIKYSDLKSISKNDITRNHSCASFIQKLRTDKSMTRKPDWSPADITKRLTYKQDKKYTERLDERSIHDNLLENSHFRSALNMGEIFLACIKTDNLQCDASNSAAFRLVFLKIVSVSLTPIR